MKKKLDASEIEIDDLKLKYENLEAENDHLLKENERLSNWQVVFNATPFAMAKYDYLRGYYYPNKALLELLNFENSELKTISPKDLFKNDDTADQILDNMISGDFWSGEIEMLKNTGETFIGTLNATPIKMINDEMIAIVSLQQDYTKNKLLEEQRELHFQYLQTLQSITLGMMRRLDLSDLLNAIIAKACSLSQVPSGFIFLFDSAKGKLVLKGACGKYKKNMGYELAPGEGFIGEVFESKEPVIIYSKDRSNSEIFKNVSGAIGVPLISGARLHGVIGLSDNEETINPKLITILEEFSSIATIAIDNSELYSDLKKEFQRRLKVETESRQQERYSKEIVKKQNEDLKKAYLDSIHRLVMASEFKDEDTGDHILRIGEYSRLIAEKMQLSSNEIEAIYYAAPMHDIGKIGIPDRIMHKPGRLTREEFEVIKTHTTIGAKLLSKSKSTILTIAEEIALNHHEKWDGSGYPNKLSGENIPLSGRIVAIADTFDALISKRHYKEPYPPEMVFNIIKNEKGRHFDPVITDLFLGNFPIFLSIRQKTGSCVEVKLENFMLSDRDKLGIKC